MIKSWFNRQDGHTKEVLLGSGLALVIRIMGAVFGLVVSVLIIRLLGADGAGVYFLALSVVTIATSIGLLGFDNTVVRFVALHSINNETNSIFFVVNSILKIIGLSLILITFLLVALAPWLANDVFAKPFMYTPLIIISFSIVPIGFVMILGAALRGLKKITSSQCVRTAIIPGLMLLFMVPCIYYWGVNGALFAYGVSCSVAFIVAWWLWRRAVSTLVDNQLAHQRTALYCLFQSGWPLFGLALSELLIQQVPTIMVGIWGEVEDVSVFSVAVKVSALLLFPLLAMISILAPKFSEMYEQGDLVNMERTAQKSSFILAMFGLITTLIIAINSEWVMGLFGNEFRDHNMILNVLLIGVFVNAATGAVSELLIMTGYELDCRNINVFGAFVTLFLCVLLIPLYGGLGAAIAIVSGVVIKNVIMVLRVKKRLGFWSISLKKGVF